MPSRADVAILRGGQERAAQQARNELAGWWATTSKSDLTKFRAEVERFFPVLVESYGQDFWQKKGRFLLLHSG